MNEGSSCGVQRLPPYVASLDSDFFKGDDVPAARTGQQPLSLPRSCVMDPARHLGH